MSHVMGNIAVQSARLDDLIALNREIAALVRAGIPLELGLRGFAGNMPNRIARLANRIADRLIDGKSLEEAIESEGFDNCSVYASVIGAGVRSGQLAETLEAIAVSSELILETRRSVALAMVHPTVVSVAAYLLLLGFVTWVIPIYLDAADSFGFASDVVFVWLRWVHDHVITFAWMTPLVIGLLLLMMLRLFQSQGTPFGSGWFDGIVPWRYRSLLTLKWLAVGATSSYSWQNQAQFAEVLRLQLEHGLPLPESFLRAANSTTDAGLRRAAKFVADSLSRGTSFSKAMSDVTTIPPMMRWTLTTGERRQTLAQTLRLMGDSYRRRAVQKARFFKVWFPIVMTVAVSGTIAFLCGLIFFGVLGSFWEGLMRE